MSCLRVQLWAVRSWQALLGLGKGCWVWASAVGSGQALLGLGKLGPAIGCRGVPSKRQPPS